MTERFEEYVQLEEEIYNSFGCDCLLTYREMQTDSGWLRGRKKLTQKFSS